MPRKPETVKIGTWPTPERIKLELMLESLFKEVKFSPRLCKEFEASIRSDIGCLYKYRKANLCTESKIKECLTRLVKTYLIYQSYCCKRK